MANGTLDFAAAKAMFDAAKKAYGTASEDDVLVDHLNPGIVSKLDIGGQGKQDSIPLRE